MQYEILQSLPPYGPDPEPFSPSGKGPYGDEALAVRFFPSRKDSWVGAFRPGLGGCNSVVEHPDGSHLVVISFGQGYIVDPHDRTHKEFFGGVVQTLVAVPELNAIVLVDPWRIECLGSRGFMWRTRRISIDGMRNLVIHGLRLIGQSCGFGDDEWISFEVDLVTGQVLGGISDH